MFNFFRRFLRRQPAHKTWVDENGLLIVSSFPHKGEGEVRAYIQPFSGRELAHVRLFRRGTDGKAHFTKTGIAVDLDELPQLAQAVDALVAAAGVGR